MQAIFKLQKPFTAVLIIAAVVMTFVTARHALGQDKEQMSPLIVRVAMFAAEQDRPDLYQDFVKGHLFPTLGTVPGYVGTFLGRDPKSGELISLSFWRSEAEAVRAEEAVGRAIRALPPGSAPRPSKVAKYVVEYRDVKGEFSR
jgi:hypothetical protein